MRHTLLWISFEDAETLGITSCTQLQNFRDHDSVQGISIETEHQVDDGSSSEERVTNQLHAKAMRECGFTFDDTLSYIVYNEPKIKIAVE